MTDAGSAYLNLLNTAARWAGIHDRQEGSPPALCTLAQQVYVLLDVATPSARREVKRSMLALTSERLIQGLDELAQRCGGELALAARDVTRTLIDTPLRSDFLSVINEQLDELGAPSASAPHLSPAQRTLGALFMDLITKQRGMDEMGQVAWISIQGYQGAAALSLLTIDLKRSERVALSLLMLQGLAEMHQARLEPEEGLAPERMLINHRFEVMSFPTERTQIKPLKSPEQRSRLTLDKHSDVWTLAQLFDQLYQGRELGRRLSGALEVPDEVDAVLVRALSRRPQDRFHSGRELRVVLEKPLLTWRDRLLHEEHQSIGLIEPSLTFDELTERRDREAEQRVQERRQRALKKRKRLQWRAARRQVFWIVMLLIIGGTGLWSWIGPKQARMQFALKRRAELTQRDQKYNPNVHHKYAHRQVRWRYVEMFGTRPALVSVSPVTAAQYLNCVTEGGCSALNAQRLPGCVVLPTQQPINCVAPIQALEFARFVNAELLEVDAWRWLAFGSDNERTFPWGEEQLTSRHAVLKWNNLPRFNTTEPHEVCTLPLGDSREGLCDVVGNLREWALLPEISQRLKESQAQGDSRPVILAHDVFGVVGADWKTRANALRLNHVDSAKAMVFSETVGFRVVRWLDPAKPVKSISPEPSVKPNSAASTKPSVTPTETRHGEKSPSVTPSVTPDPSSTPSPLKEGGDD